MRGLRLGPEHTARSVGAQKLTVVLLGGSRVETGILDVKTTSLAAFAAQLRSWRLQMGWTQVEMGSKLGYSASLVSGIETMDKAPTADFAARCDEVLGTPGTFAALQELVAREAYPAFFAPVIPFEREAVRIHGWELGAVPGLLQTGDYAHALIRSGRPMDSEDEIDRIAAARLERQEIVAGQTAVALVRPGRKRAAARGRRPGRHAAPTGPAARRGGRARRRGPDPAARGRQSCRRRRADLRLRLRVVAKRVLHGVL